MNTICAIDPSSEATDVVHCNSGPPTRTEGGSSLSGVYGIWCTANERWYVGRSVNIPARWHSHMSTLIRGVHINPHLQRAWNTYGHTAFLWVVLELAAPARLETLELRYTVQLQALTPLGFVLIAGGSQIHIPDETRKRISDAKRGVKFTEEHLRNMAAAQRGKRASLETRRRMSAARAGYRHSAETRAKIAASNRQRRLSSATRAKISAAHAGMRPSAATRDKMSRSRLRYLEQARTA